MNPIKINIYKTKSEYIKIVKIVELKITCVCYLQIRRDNKLQ